MSHGFPAILIPQLREDCSEFKINKEEESWIGDDYNLNFGFKKWPLVPISRLSSQKTINFVLLLAIYLWIYVGQPRQALKMCA